MTKLSKKFYRKDKKFLLTERNSSKNIAFFRKIFLQILSLIKENFVQASCLIPSAQSPIILANSKKLKHFFFQKSFSRKCCTGVVQFLFNNASDIFLRKDQKNFRQRPKRFEYCTNFSKKISPTVPVDPYHADLTNIKFAKVRKIFAFN